MRYDIKTPENFHDKSYLINVIQNANHRYIIIRQNQKTSDMAFTTPPTDSDYLFPVAILRLPVVENDRIIPLICSLAEERRVCFHWGGDLHFVPFGDTKLPCYLWNLHFKSRKLNLHVAHWVFFSLSKVVKRMIVGSAWRSNGNIFLSISFCLSASFL
ncbi:phospholipase D delta-like [Gossypium australe]|uniref:Phospholipase D delta-like n=1 Tax=Gossypium australe TaxID=47621 RepID=A0A5B6V1A9_9ROSI|nr:phospholipase D delta-like [Gossypium australe]